MQDILQPAAGAIIGFLLAQFVNLVVFGARWFVRPKLRIESLGGEYRLLSRTTEIGPGEQASEVQYGFNLRNSGCSIAVSVRFQITRIEVRHQRDGKFVIVADSAFDLFSYHGADTGHGSREVTIVPGAAVQVGLASWRADFDALLPAIENRPDLYEEFCSGATEYRFKIVAFAENARFTEKTVPISPPRR